MGLWVHRSESFNTFGVGRLAGHVVVHLQVPSVTSTVQNKSLWTGVCGLPPIAPMTGVKDGAPEVLWPDQLAESRSFPPLRQAQGRLLAQRTRQRWGTRRFDLGSNHPCFVVNAQLSPRQKLTMEQQRMAMPFETTTGMCAVCTRMGMSARLPTMETMPFAR